jgi:hypothetical protein
MMYPTSTTSAAGERDGVPVGEVVADDVSRLPVSDGGADTVVSESSKGEPIPSSDGELISVSIRGHVSYSCK